MLIMINNSSAIIKFILDLAIKFNIKKLDLASNFFGIQINKIKNMQFLHHHHYAMKLLHKESLANAKPMNNSLPGKISHTMAQ